MVHLYNHKVPCKFYREIRFVWHLKDDQAFHLIITETISSNINIVL